MKITFFNHSRIRQLLTVVFLSGALACMFPPATPAFEWWARHSVGVALSYVVLALFFLLLKNSRLMFVCLGCGAVISFHHHERMMRDLQRQQMQLQYQGGEVPYVPPPLGHLSNYALPDVCTPPH